MKQTVYVKTPIENKHEDNIHIGLDKEGNAYHAFIWQDALGFYASSDEWGKVYLTHVLEEVEIPTDEEMEEASIIYSNDGFVIAAFRVGYNYLKSKLQGK